MQAIIGHDKILAFFKKVMANGNLSHAYCFVGPEKVGKRAVAETIAADLLQVSREKLLGQPDYTVVEQLFDEKKEKTKKNISVEQMREVRETLSRRSYLAGYKVAIIDEAEKMNEESANALLKTLEEPAEKTILFLITSNEDKLPETIKSRCQTIYFQSVALSLIEENLILLGLKENEAKAMALWSRGLPGQALVWQNNPDEWTWYQNEVARFSSLAGKSFFEKIKLVEELFGDKTDHIATREKLQNILSLWQMLTRDGFLQKQGWDNLAVHQLVGDWDEKLSVKIYSQLEQARDLLNKNIHPRLLVENILLEMP